MTHQEYFDKCQILRSLANELHRYAEECLNDYWKASDTKLSYAELRNYGNNERAKLALHTIGNLSAFELNFYPMHQENE